MRKETINIYKFNELDIKIQDKVIEKFRENNDYPTLSEDLTEECKYQLNEHNIEIIDKLKVYYDLSYTQGSGTMFEGKFKWDKYYATIKQSGHYYHYNSKDITLELIDEPDELTDKEYDYYIKQHNKDYDEFNDIYVSICKGLEKYGYNQIEYEDSEESIKEMIDSNDYEFYDNGEIV